MAVARQYALATERIDSSSGGVAAGSGGWVAAGSGGWVAAGSGGGVAAGSGGGVATAAAALLCFAASAAHISTREIPQPQLSCKLWSSVTTASSSQDSTCAAAMTADQIIFLRTRSRSCALRSLALLSLVTHHSVRSGFDLRQAPICSRSCHTAWTVVRSFPMNQPWRSAWNPVQLRHAAGAVLRFIAGMGGTQPSASSTLPIAAATLLATLLAAAAEGETARAPPAAEEGSAAAWTGDWTGDNPPSADP